MFVHRPLQSCAMILPAYVPAINPYDYDESVGESAENSTKQTASKTAMLYDIIDRTKYSFIQNAELPMTKDSLNLLRQLLCEPRVVENVQFYMDRVYLHMWNILYDRVKIDLIQIGRDLCCLQNWLEYTLIGEEWEDKFFDFIRKKDYAGFINAFAMYYALFNLEYPYQ